MIDINSIILAATEAVAEAGAEHAADPGLLGTLGINWKLFLAQLVNFGIVLFIFWKWVVKPLGNTLTRRQERIEEGLKNADRMDVERKKFEDWKQAEMKKVRVEADHILRTSTDAANKIKMETIADAHAQANRLMEQTKASIESEKAKTISEAKQEIATLVVAATEKILQGKLDEKKDQELINNSIKSVK